MYFNNLHNGTMHTSILIGVNIFCSTITFPFLTYWVTWFTFKSLKYWSECVGMLVRRKEVCHYFHLNRYTKKNMGRTPVWIISNFSFSFLHISMFLNPHKQAIKFSLVNWQVFFLKKKCLALNSQHKQSLQWYQELLCLSGKKPWKVLGCEQTDIES